MCGGTIEVKEGQNVVTCEFCGATQTVHSFDNEKKTTYFKRAEALRFRCEFDKAAGIYETIVSEFPREPEAYWGLVLCKYGIEYVDDPKTGLKIPTCHRTRFESIYDDTDYNNVIKYADVVARDVYEKEAKAISKLQKSILDISSREDPFDIFICYKETDSKGDRTPDSVLAQDIYKELTHEGYRVFFSRITLEDKLGSQYEPYIFAALHSSKVMIHVTTSDENSESVWVKNEWQRYLSLIQEGQKKTLIPCYKGISAYELPDEMQNLQGQDMAKLGSMQDLIRGINKILGKSRKSSSNDRYGLENGAAQDAFDSQVNKGYVYLSKEMWEEAEETFHAATKLVPLCGRAYIGLMLAKAQAESIDYLLENDGYEAKALTMLGIAESFADQKCKDEIAEINRKIEHVKYEEKKDNLKQKLDYTYWDDALEVINSEADEEHKKEFTEMYKEALYNDSCADLERISNASEVGSFDRLEEHFTVLGDYKDSKNQLLVCVEKRQKIMDEYDASCLNELALPLVAEPKLDDLIKVIEKIIDNKSHTFTPRPFSDTFDEKFAQLTDEGYKYVESKSLNLISTFKTLESCNKLRTNIKSLRSDDAFKSVYKALDEKEKYIIDVNKAVKRKKTIKGLKISGIVAAGLAVVTGVVFGIKGIVDAKNRSNTYTNAAVAMENGNYDDAILYYESLGDYKEAKKKIEVCNGLKELKESIETKSEADAIKGIKRIVSAGEKVNVSYETENNPNIKRLAGGNSGNKTETIDNVDFTLYQPTWSGYTFLNWNSESVSYKEELTSLALMSNWSLNTYTISYELNGGTNHQDNPVSYTVETNTITLKNPSKTGYSFTGWYKGTEKVTTINKGSVGNISLEAQWQANQYTITLNANSGTVTPTSIVTTYDAPFTLPTPTRNGYGFDGWYDSKNTKWTDGNYTVANNVTLTAHWTPTAYTITYVLNGGTNSSANPSSYTIEDSITFSNPSRTGYHFDGWFDDNNSQVTGISLGSTGNVKITAQWTINTYTVTFVNYNGSTLSTTTVDHGGTAVYNGATPTKPATAQYTYSWTGWDKPLTNITEDTVFTAQYSSTVNKYTITWKNYDGSTLKTDSISYGSMPSYSGATPTKPSDTYKYTFSGWSPTITIVTGDKIYTAQYTSEPTYIYSLKSDNTYAIEGTNAKDAEVYNIPSQYNGKTVTEILSDAFSDCPNLKEAFVPSSVTKLNEGCFRNCSKIEKITLPHLGRNNRSHKNTPTSIYAHFGIIFGLTSFDNTVEVSMSFSEEGVKSVYVPKSLTTVVVDRTGASTLGGSVVEMVFRGCYMIKNITFGNGVGGIGPSSVSGCANLQTVSIGKDVEEICDDAFSGCSYLTSVTIADGLQKLGGFSKCSSLASIHIPNTVTEIYSRAFERCSSLTEVNLPETVVKMGSNIFKGCVSLKKISIPFFGSVEQSENTYVAENCLGNLFTDYYDSSYTVDTTKEEAVVQYYDTRGFSTKSKTFYIPKSLEEVVVYRGCLNQGSFDGCTMLKKIKVLSENIDVTDRCFRNCSSLIDLRIPNHNGALYTYCFANCEKLSTIILGHITYASTGAFYYCPVTRVYIKGNTESWNQIKADTDLKGSPCYYSEYQPSDTSVSWWHYVNGEPTLW